MELRENDFKYVIQDFSHVYIGARMTYEEVGEDYDTPSKVKSAIYRFVLDEYDLEEPICKHLIELPQKSKTYLMYKQLDVKIKVGFFEKKMDKKGVEREEYVSRMYSIKELVEDSALKENLESYIIQEISFSKRKLMSLAV